MKVSHLSKSIHNRSILNDLSFTIRTGSITGIIGRNGAGKTTLLRTMAGILVPDRGDVTINGKSIIRHPSEKQSLIFVPDNLEALKTYSTKELIHLYTLVYPRFDMDYFEEMRAQFSLPDVTRLTKYSKGMKALFILILSFACRVDYLLLDEPTDGLDAVVKKKVLHFLTEQARANQVSVMIASHRLEELDYMVDDVLILRNGELDEHFAIHDLKKQYRKLQVAYEGEALIPDSIRNRVIELDRTGSVHAILITNEDKTVYDQLKDSQPILLEELTLSLEDLFLARLGGNDDVL